MIKRILTVILVTFSFQIHAQEKTVLEKPTVNKRVELMSIVFRLAERPEYSNNFKLYSDRIEQHFGKFKNHELIQFTKSIIAERDIAYDAVAWMSIYLNDNLELIKDVQQEVWQRDTRWTKEIVEKFIPLLQQFAQDTGFDDFFHDNTDLYADAVKRINPLYKSLDLDWYFSFYGKEPSEIFSIIIGLGNGSNYGPSLDYTNGNKKVYSIVGITEIDSTDMPKFDYNPLASLLFIHEFNHSFVNYLIDKNKEAFKESEDKIFSVVKDTFAKQGLVKEAVVYEGIVRAAVIKYMKDHDFDQRMVEGLTNWEKECGFFWIENLVEELENYAVQRDKYPTLDSYMPILIEAYNIWAEHKPNSAPPPPM